MRGGSRGPERFPPTSLKETSRVVRSQPDTVDVFGAELTKRNGAELKETVGGKINKLEEELHSRSKYGWEPSARPDSLSPNERK